MMRNSLRLTARTGLASTILTGVVAWSLTARGDTPELFEIRSPEATRTQIDITVREVERRPRSSVIRIEVRKAGSSVGHSFFILCSIRKLAIARGAGRYIATLEDYGSRDDTLVAFLRSEQERPADADPDFASSTRTKIADLELFAPICDVMP